MQGKIGKILLKTLAPKAKPFEIYDTDLPDFLVRVQP
jgi:hypothetical protein